MHSRDLTAVMMSWHGLHATRLVKFCVSSVISRQPLHPQSPAALPAMLEEAVFCCRYSPACSAGVTKKSCSREARARGAHIDKQQQRHLQGREGRDGPQRHRLQVRRMPSLQHPAAARRTLDFQRTRTDRRERGQESGRYPITKKN